MANLIKMIPRGTRMYKGKLPFKCFNFGRTGDFAAKFPHKEGNFNQSKVQSKEHQMKTKNLYSKVDLELTTDDDEDNSDIERNEIMFLSMENHHHKEETNKENEEEFVVDIESKLVASLEEIENLRENSERQ